jgi:phosphatidylglycerophosphatase A
MGAILRVNRLIATFLGAGYSPVAPGTAGTFATLPLYLLLRKLSLPRYLLSVSVLTVLGISAASRMEALWGKDPSRVVIDEVVGFLIALVSRPKGIKDILIAFVLFRFFDVVKPPPARNLEALPGGFGIMADDIAAGAMSALVLAGIRKLSKR